ncbi:molybdate transport system substrate-binding protein [Panacagrimonas perspica]|uniref:Molybdate transport system substrate-binding protein n=1 Tax=Panacagrimonas perspica TaxID=381431 RepID=A0A4R7NTY7_9GAMM|nr:molybdate ABC transporter substrate-binding protein [Panacagrimonas perspica]TDU24179.1 molybdate transport system substrate-binding protein [Panacagrimonas perspica]THD04591.1 molybdate ABC transporter substrate-binding protein [Panacagrimonas perspica]
MRFLRHALFCLLLLPVTLHAEDAVRVYAAASLTNAVGDIATAWQKDGHPKATLVFAASSALAKQIENGAPADVFASADRKWMDYLAQRKKIDAATRVELLGNELVLIVPKGKAFPLTVDKGFDLAGAYKGKLCTGEPDVVPVGTYAKQALTALGWWGAMSPRIVGTDDVRTALAFVERGECPLGIVYATDAAISDKVEVVGRFPARSHEPIVYPFALVGGAGSQAGAFLEYLKSDAAQAIFRRYGFTPATR